MNNSRKIVPLGSMIIRQFSRTAPKNSEAVAPRFQKLKEKQKKFGVEDNIPVHLKGGVADKLLYQLTAVVTLVGVGLSFQTFYRLINK